MNPYATPDSDPLATTSEVDKIRKDHLNHEASIKSIGILYLLSGPIFVVLGILPVFGGVSVDVLEVVLSITFVVLGLAQIWTGEKLRKLSSRARIPAAIFAGIGLLGFPLGTIVGIYFLYLLLGKKGRMVLSEPYREVIAATPHIRYKTSIVVWILLALLVVAVVVGAAAVFRGF